MSLSGREGNQHSVRWKGRREILRDGFAGYLQGEAMEDEASRSYGEFEQGRMKCICRHISGLP